MIHCQLCKDTRYYANHVDCSTAAKGVHKRMGLHFNPTRSCHQPKGIALPASEILAVIRKDGPDPNGLRQDSNVHWSYEHYQFGIGSARVTILERVVGTYQQRSREEHFKNTMGSYSYNVEEGVV